MMEAVGAEVLNLRDRALGAGECPWPGCPYRFGIKPHGSEYRYSSLTSYVVAPFIELGLAIIFLPSEVSDSQCPVLEAVDERPFGRRLGGAQEPCAG